MLLEAQKDVPAAEAQYQKTLAVDPNAAVAANNLAWIYVASNRNLDQALQLAQTALKALPEEPHVNDTLGLDLLPEGPLQPGRAPPRTEHQPRPADPAVHYHLGMAYVQTGDIEKAKGRSRRRCR